MSLFIKGLIILSSLYIMLRIHHNYDKLKRAQRWFSKRKFPKELEAGVNENVLLLYRALLAALQYSLNGRSQEIIKLYLQQGVILINSSQPISTSFNGVDIAKALQLLKYDFLTVYGHAKIGDNAITETMMIATVTTLDDAVLEKQARGLPNLSDANAVAESIFEYGVLFQKEPCFLLNITAVIATSDTNPYFAKHFLGKDD